MDPNQPEYPWHKLLDVERQHLGERVKIGLSKGRPRNNAVMVRMQIRVSEDQKKSLDALLVDLSGIDDLANGRLIAFAILYLRDRLAGSAPERLSKIKTFSGLRDYLSELDLKSGSKDAPKRRKALSE